MENKIWRKTCCTGVLRTRLRKLKMIQWCKWLQRIYQLFYHSTADQAWALPDVPIYCDSVYVTDPAIPMSQNKVTAEIDLDDTVCYEHSVPKSISRNCLKVPIWPETISKTRIIGTIVPIQKNCPHRPACKIHSVFFSHLVVGHTNFSHDNSFKNILDVCTIFPKIFKRVVS